MTDNLTNKLKDYLKRFKKHLAGSSLDMRMGRGFQIMLTLAAILYFCYTFLFVYVEPDEYGIKVVRVGMTRGVQKEVYERQRPPMFLPQGYSSEKNYSDESSARIDEEVSMMMEEAHRRVHKILSDKRALIDKLAALLSKQETVRGNELRAMMSS